jgi:hypothetical protein
MTTVTWVAGISGDWTVGTNWEGGLAPLYDQDAAILAGTADTYSTATVEAGDDVSVAGLVIGPATSTSGPTPMVVVVGTLAVAGVITLDGGELYVGTYAVATTGGELVGGTVDVASGRLILPGSTLFAPGGGELVEGTTLDGIAIDATGSLSLPGAALVVGGLTVTATTLAGGLLEFAGTQVLSAQTVEGADFTVAGTLTLAASDVLTGGFTFGSGDNSYDDLDTVINDGTIAAAPSFDLLAGLLNNGLFVAAGTNEVDYQNIGNAGTLELTAGASLTIGTDNANATHILTNTGLIQIVAGSTLTLDNDAGLGDAGNTDPDSDNAGGTVEIDTGGVLALQAGLSGGTIVSRGGTLGSVGFSGTLEDLALTGSVVVVGLTIDPLTSFVGSTPGSSLDLDAQGLVAFSGAETVANVDLTLDSRSVLGESSVTLADSTSVTPGANGGGIAAATTLLLQGMVGAAAGTVELAGTVALINTGTIQTAAGESLVLYGDSIANTGRIVIAAGNTLTVGGTIGAATLASFTFEGAVTLNLGTVVGGVLTIAAGDTLANVGHIDGVTVDDAGVLGTVGTLDAVTWNGAPLDLSNSDNANVAGGLTVTDGQGGAGTIILGGTDSQLTLDDPETLDHVVIDIGDTVASPDTNDQAILQGSSLGATPITFGANATVDVSGNLPLEGIGPAGTLTNDGVINFGPQGVAGDSGTGLAVLDVSEVVNNGFIALGSLPMQQGVLQGAMTAADLNSQGVTNVAVVNAGTDDSRMGIPSNPNDIGWGFIYGSIEGMLSSGVRGSALATTPTAPTTAPNNAAQVADETTLTGSGTILLGAGANADLDAQIGASQTIEFANTLALATFTDPAKVLAQITGFGNLDVIDLAGQAYSGGTASYDGGTLAVPTSNGTFSLNVAFASGYSGADVQLADDGQGGTIAFIATVACFARGTLIATTHGPVPVEALSVGNNVALAGGGTARIVWLGHRRVACARHPRPDSVWPVRIARDSFGPGQPCRDLFLSPDHAVFCNGVLIPVRHLIDGEGIAQIPCDAVEYWHVELARHDVLLAEGLPCESFLDTGNRAAFGNGGVVVDAHPDFARRVWDAEACAPLVVAGPRLAAARSLIQKWSERRDSNPRPPVPQSRTGA